VISRAMLSGGRAQRGINFSVAQHDRATGTRSGFTSEFVLMCR